MRFHGTITVYRYENQWEPETTEIYADYFEAKSIQSAKAHLTKLANTTELFSWVQSWDNEKRSFTGKDIRWKPWSAAFTYTQQNGLEVVSQSSRISDREFEEIVSDPDYKYGKTVEYRVDINLRWRNNNER